MKFEKFDSMGYLMEFSYLSITDYFNVRSVVCTELRSEREGSVVCKSIFLTMVICERSRALGLKTKYDNFVLG